MEEQRQMYIYGYINKLGKGCGNTFRSTNQKKLYTALDDKTPDEFYFNNLPALPKAV